MAIRLAVAAALLLASLAAPATASTVPPLSTALVRTEAVRAVRDVQHLLAHYIDRAEWDAAAALFSADARLDLGAGEVRGRTAIRAALIQHFGAGRSGREGLRAILQMAPVLTLSPEGQSAKGRWHEVGLFGGEGATTNWTGGIYENEYVLENGEWRISRLGYHPTFAGDFAEGWFNVPEDLPVVPYHYEADKVGTPAHSTAASDAPVPDIPEDLVAARAQRLEDEDAVRNLQYIYGYYADRRMWDDVVDLFGPGGSIAVSDIGTYRGTDGIRAVLEREGPAGLAPGDLNDHPILNVVVCVAPDGRTARARGFKFGMTGNNAAKAFWSLTVFDNLFEKSGGVWRIAQVREFPRMRTDHRTSWDQGIQPLPAPARKADGPAPAEPPILVGCAPPRPAQAPLDGARARAQIEAAAATVAIDNVSNAFANYIDDFEWRDLSRMFSRDGQREAPGIGFYRGPDRIYRMQHGRYGDRRHPRTSIPIHARIQPVIHVAPGGTEAALRTRLLQFNSSVRAPGRSGSMMAGIYEDRAVLEDGVWRLSHVEIDHYLQTRSYRDAWTRIPEGLGHRMIPPADKVLRELPPDAPLLGEIYAPYPTVGLMWFHYVNPVSGRKPDYLTPKTAAVMSRTEEPLEP